MRTVPLHGKKAAGRVAVVDDEDYELIMRYRWHIYERVRPNGSIMGPYATTGVRKEDGRFTIMQMHRLLLAGVSQVDHEDCDGLNNQRSNLRAATSLQNQANGRKPQTYNGKPTSSRFKGVYWHKAAGKWLAQIGAAGKHRYLGIFADEAEAARAYDTAAREAFGEFARVNFP